MRICFETEQERENVKATIKRLIETVNERSHSTAEEYNLNKALIIIAGNPTVYEAQTYNLDRG